MRRIAIIGNPNSVFIQDICAHLEGKYTLFLLHSVAGADYTSGSASSVKCIYVKESRLPKFGLLADAVRYSRLIKKLNVETVQVHYLTILSVLVIALVPPKIRTIISFWGSDLHLGASSLIMLARRIAVRRADSVSVSTKAMRDIFLKVYGAKYLRKLRQAVFALPNIEKLSSMKSGFRKRDGRIRVVCGSKAVAQHNHVTMIEAIGKMDGDIRSKCEFILPMTYPFNEQARNYVKKIRALAYQNGIAPIIIDQFMQPEDLAELILGTDVFINLQDMDAQSAAMQEYLFAGVVVICGGWLPYEDMERDGVFLVKIPSLDSFGAEFERVYGDLEKYRLMSKQNEAVIWKRSSWEGCGSGWVDLIEGKGQAFADQH